MSNASFKRNFAKVLERAGAKAEQVVRAGALEITKRIIEKSPVDTGRFRGNWQVQAGSINFDTSAAPDKTGKGALIKGGAVIAKFPMGATIYITNSLPYSRRLEYDAWSKQATAGMVRITVVEYKQIIRQVAASIK